MESSYDRRVLIAGDKTLRWSGGKPPFQTCELAGLELSFFGSPGFLHRPKYLTTFVRDFLSMVRNFFQKAEDSGLPLTEPLPPRGSAWQETGDPDN